MTYNKCGQGRRSCRTESGPSCLGSRNVSFLGSYVLEVARLPCACERRPGVAAEHELRLTARAMDQWYENVVPKVLDLLFAAMLLDQRLFSRWRGKQFRLAVSLWAELSAERALDYVHLFFDPLAIAFLAFDELEWLAVRSEHRFASGYALNEFRFDRLAP